MIDAIIREGLKGIISSCYSAFEKWSQRHDTDQLPYRYFSPIEQERLMRILSEHSGQTDPSFIYLPPFTKDEDWYPVLAIKFNFDRDPVEFRIRVVAYAKVNESDEWKGVGFRFESDEGVGPGMHSYYHMQLIRAPFKSETAQIMGFEHVPEAQPAIPIDASNPLEMLINVLISLYGIKEFIKTFSGDDPARLKGNVHSPKCIHTPFHPKITHPDSRNVVRVINNIFIKLDKNPFQNREIRIKRAFLIIRNERGMHYNGKSFQGNTSVFDIDYRQNEYKIDLHTNIADRGDYKIECIVEYSENRVEWQVKDAISVELR